MSTRDQRLAEKYAAKGKVSASESARQKNAQPSTAEDPMESMRRAIAAPRSQDSLDRAATHKRNLPPLG